MILLQKLIFKYYSGNAGMQKIKVQLHIFLANLAS